MNIPIESMISLATSLLLVLDPIGNLPIFSNLLKSIPVKKRLCLMRREMFISLIGMILILFTGDLLLFKLFQLPEYTLYIAGSLVLGSMGYNIIFSGSDSIVNVDESNKNLLIFPISIPLVLGPGSIILIMIIDKTLGHFYGFIVVFGAWIINTLISMTSVFTSRFIGSHTGIIKGIDFIIGFLIVMMAIGMGVTGIESWVKISQIF